MLDVLSGGASTSGSDAAISGTSSSGSGLQLDTAAQRWEESIDVLLKAFGESHSAMRARSTIPGNFDLPEAGPEAASADLGHGAESVCDRGGRAARVQRAHRRIRPAVERLGEFGKVFGKMVEETKPERRPLVGVQRAVYVTEGPRGCARRCRARALEHACDDELAQQLRARGERATPSPFPARPSPRPMNCSRASRHRHARNVRSPDQARPGHGGHLALQLQLLVRRPDQAAVLQVDGALRARGDAGVRLRPPSLPVPPQRLIGTAGRSC